MSSKSSFYNNSGITNTQTNAIDASVDSAEASATASQNSANNASASSNTATTKASEASTSASTATTKASEASTSASTATTKASEASTSASTATTKASESASSATASANSATAASNSSSTATTKASEASSSASTALSHKNDAQTAKTAAETAETNAETAETNVASSATAASNSASSASTSASTANTKAGQAATSASTATTKASEAATSASNASTSASTATTKASEASTSANNAASSATAASSSKDAALAALDSFDDRYLGVKSSNPSVDNDGNSLVAGSLYFNSTDDTMKVYEGSAWVAAYASVSGAVLKTGSAMTGNLSLGDNNKAIFGAGSDLQIYHDASNSYIQESGTGNLFVRASNLVLADVDGTQFLTGTANSDVKLFHNNLQKIATTATGVDITGTVTSDGMTSTTGTSMTQLTVNGTGAIESGVNFASGGTTYGQIYFNNVGPYDFSVMQQYTTGSLVLGTNDTERMRIDTSGKLLIGDSSSHTADLLQIETPASGGGHGIQIRRNDSNTDQSVGSITFGNNTATDLASVHAKTDGATDNGALLFSTSVSGGANTERMRIDDVGNVGIGISAPASALDVAGNITSTGRLRLTNSGSSVDTVKASVGTLSGGFFANTPNGNAFYHAVAGNSITYNDAGLHWFKVSGTERLRVNSTGIVVTGTVTATSLDISGNIDVDGVTNLDVVDIDGAVDMASTLAVAGVLTGASLDISGDIDVDGTTNLDVVDIDGALTQDGGAVFNEASADVDFRIESNGNANMLFVDGGNNRVGVGTASPASALDVTGTVTADHILIGATAQIGTGSNIIKATGDTLALDVYTATSAVGRDVFSVRSDIGGSETKVGVIEANGDFQSATNSYGSTSDERIKQDIVDANSQIDDVKNIRLRNYRLIDHVTAYGDDAKVHLGTVAQELEASGMNGLVSENEDGIKGVRYSVMLLKALGALQETIKMVEDLQAENTAIKARLTALEG